MRQVFSFLQEEARRLFPSDATVKYSSVSGFIFLRFFCPCVLGPRLFGVRDELPDAGIMRTLTLVAKTLINLANGVEFGLKEAYMNDMNVFIAQEKESMRAFIDTLANNWQTGTPATCWRSLSNRPTINNTARGRVREMESRMALEQSLLDKFLTVQTTMREDPKKKKANDGDLQKSIRESREQIASLAREVERLRRMIAVNSDSRYGFWCVAMSFIVFHRFSLFFHLFFVFCFFFD